MKLIDKTTGNERRKGDKVTTFRGELGRLTGWREPQHSGSTGRVYVTLDNSDPAWGDYEWFPSVINAEFVE